MMFFEHRNVSGPPPENRGTVKRVVRG
jgi:hypothetical protein